MRIAPAAAMTIKIPMFRSICVTLSQFALGNATMSVKPNPITILQDTRERTPRRFSNECTVQVVTFTEGDYSLAAFSDRVRVGRKSLADLGWARKIPR